MSERLSKQLAREIASERDPAPSPPDTGSGERIDVFENDLPAFFEECATASDAHTVGRVRLLACALCGALVPFDYRLHWLNQHVRWHAEESRHG